MKKAVTKHHQLATTGHAEGLCHGGMTKGYKKGGLIKGEVHNEKGGTKMEDSAKEMHHHINVKHEKGMKHHVHIHHH